VEIKKQKLEQVVIVTEHKNLESNVQVPKRTRKVKVTHTYINSKGYTVTEDKEVDEEIDSAIPNKIEILAKNPIQNKIDHTITKTKTNNPSKQGDIMNFFSKK